DNLVFRSASPEMGQNIQLRRSVIADAFSKRATTDTGWLIPGGDGEKHYGYAGGSHAQGLYASDIDGLLIEENVFDHNGWKEGVAGAERTIYNHNLYIQSDNSPDVTVRGNIIANAAAHGAQLRPGGIMEDNLFIGNGTGAYIDGAGGAAIENVFVH